jgi:alanyl-tRNA synthetase
LIGNGVEFTVIDTQKDGELWIHVGHLTKGKLAVGQTVTAKVDADRRAGIRRAHSATHMLHHALRTHLDENATQRGSKVDQDQMRFDFSWPTSLTAEQLTRIEDTINEKIASGSAITTELLNIEDARAKGAMALFGEKYPDRVRVVSMGDFSVELCGGTHLSNSGQVGLCKVLSDEPVAKGIRRISCLTGPKALQRLRDTESLLKEVAQAVKVPNAEDIVRRVTQLQDELRDAKRELAKQASANIAGLVDDLIAKAEDINGAKIITHLAEGLDRDSLREFADKLRGKAKSAAVLLAAVIDGKPCLLAAVTKDLNDKGVKAGDCVRDAAKVIGGGGGGRPDLAEAGGKDATKLPEALTTGAAVYRKALAK